MGYNFCNFVNFYAIREIGPFLKRRDILSKMPRKMHENEEKIPKNVPFAKIDIYKTKFLPCLSTELNPLYNKYPRKNVPLKYNKTLWCMMR